MCAYILVVGGSVGTGVDFRVTGFLLLLGPTGIDGVTVIVRVVTGSSLGGVEASVISGL